MSDSRVKISAASSLVNVQRSSGKICPAVLALQFPLGLEAKTQFPYGFCSKRTHSHRMQSQHSTGVLSVARNPPYDGTERFIVGTCRKSAPSCSHIYGVKTFIVKVQVTVKGKSDITSPNHIKKKLAGVCDIAWYTMSSRLNWALSIKPNKMVSSCLMRVALLHKARL